MALASTSPLAATAARPKTSAPLTLCRSGRLQRIFCQATTDSPRGGNASNTSPSPPRWRVAVSAALAAAVVVAMPAHADLNKYEADQRGEFGIGSAAQFGNADLKNTVHVNENFRL
uniref:Uncharacterized protein n=1 Tax=Aegilops tauschii subsp. strangulata TaxID=200361 RepID=A0A453P687_AEGTS